MGSITPIVDFSTELADLFDLGGKVAYLPGGYQFLDIERDAEADTQVELCACLRGGRLSFELVHRLLEQARVHLEAHRRHVAVLAPVGVEVWTHCVS